MPFGNEYWLSLMKGSEHRAPARQMREVSQSYIFTISLAGKMCIQDDLKIHPFEMPSTPGQNQALQLRT